MSKVDTLLNLITYQKQHPHAKNSQVAQAIGITPQYLNRCQREVFLLKQHLSERPLDPDHVRLLMSLLHQHDPYQREIFQSLQKLLFSSPPAGILRIASPNEKAPYGWLAIGEVVPEETGAKDRLPPLLEFWLRHLCYEPLFRVRQDGEIDWRLATTCEPVKNDSQWRIRLRSDLFWSDGKPITARDVEKALSESQIAPLIKAIRTYGEIGIRIQLSQPVPLFPLRLRGVLIRPAHSPHPYRVTSGAYRVKRFRPDATTFRFERHREYYQPHEICIDWLTLKRFVHPANAIKAFARQELDFMHLRAVEHCYPISDSLSIQQWPFFQDSYYVLFLNRHRGLLSDGRNCRLLAEAIDYRAINRYLHAGRHTDKRGICSPCRYSLELRITISKGDWAIPYLSYLVGKSVGASVIHPVFSDGLPPKTMRKTADAFLTQIYFGHAYSRLSRFFGADGENNPFGYANRRVDQMLCQLSQTQDMLQRQGIGQKILSLLQADFAVILLAPCFEYFLSPLVLQFDENLTRLLDFAQNLSRLVVERHPVRR